MTAPPLWSPGDPDATIHPSARAREGERVAFKNLLGVVPLYMPGQPGFQINRATITLQFTVGPASLAVETAAGSPEQFAETVRKRMRRRRRSYSFGPTYPAEVAGYPGLARVITARKRRRLPASAPVIQMYTVLGPYAVMVTTPQGPTPPGVGRVGLYPAAPPVTSPVVRLPAADPLSVEEKLTIVRGGIRLTGLVSPGRVVSSTEEFAMNTLNTLRSRVRDLAVDNWQPDVFLGGQPCIRDTFLRGGLRGDPVRSEFWWAGVVNGRGIQLFVSGTKSIINMDEARPLRDVVVLLPPD